MSSESFESYNIPPPIPPIPPIISGLYIINPDKLTNNNQIQQEQTYEKPFEEGLFNYIKDQHSRKILVNAWNAITQLNLWDFMKKQQESYLLDNEPEIMMITNKMNELGYDRHSGCSFAWTMRQIQYIARHGEKKYMETFSE